MPGGRGRQSAHQASLVEHQVDLPRGLPGCSSCDGDHKSATRLARRRAANSWRAFADHAAGDAIAGIPGGIAHVVVLAGVDHHRGAAFDGTPNWASPRGVEIERARKLQRLLEGSTVRIAVPA